MNVNMLYIVGKQEECYLTLNAWITPGNSVPNCFGLLPDFKSFISSAQVDY